MENIYFRCRKNAAQHNDKLNSREGAAELLGISVSTLANYELGITKVVPVDAVVMMADLYQAPELKAHYCKHTCPNCALKRRSAPKQAASNGWQYAWRSWRVRTTWETSATGCWTSPRTAE